MARRGREEQRLVRASLTKRLRIYLLEPLLVRQPRHAVPDSATQIGLSLFYKELARSGAKLPSFREVGFKAYSQADEDGILLYIFSLIGTTNKKCVEVAAGDGTECNTANLIINHRWSGLLFDNNPDLVYRGQRFFRKHPATYPYPPKFVCAWITRENVNSLIRENGFEGEIDLLSLDVDGVDYWLWDAINVISPRVVVVEYQDILGPERACTVPYKDDFFARNYPAPQGMLDYAGASLPAFVKLGKVKGYRLVGCNAYGYNAFFIKNGVGEEILCEGAVADCFNHPRAIRRMNERFQAVKDLPWVDV